MKLMTVVGTRPELIRLSRIIPLLDNYCDHILVHTGQNYDPNLKDVFFEDLKIRSPNYQGNCSGNTTFETISNILQLTEGIIAKENPDKFLILGDTNSSLSAIVAQRMGIPVFHMESGNRCYDSKVPEEINRQIIDHCSNIWMPYTERSRQNLLREGIQSDKIYVTGNPIFEVLNYYQPQISQSNIMQKLNVLPKKYFLVTIHRSENVDNPDVLSQLLYSLFALSNIYPLYKVIISMHPHTIKQIYDEDKFFISSPQFIVNEPFGFFDFVYLEQNAACVISDSGTVQEECCIYGSPNITIRTTTERPETIEFGCNIITGYETDNIIRSVAIAMNTPIDNINPYGDYTKQNVSTTVAKIIFGVNK